MHKTISILALISLSTSAFAAETYEIDSGHASAGFAVKHLMVSTVRGNFSDIKGKVVYDPAAPQNSTVEATIEVKTVDTKQEKRDEHLRSPDFFDTEKFPVMTFKSTKVTPVGDGLAVTGDMTIHGVTKPVTLQVSGPSAVIKDPWGNIKRGVSATTTLSRKDFGLTWNKALEAGGVVVGDEVKVELDLELQKVEDRMTAAH